MEIVNSKLIKELDEYKKINKNLSNKLVNSEQSLSQKESLIPILEMKTSYEENLKNDMVILADENTKLKKDLLNIQDDLQYAKT